MTHAPTGTQCLGATHGPGPQAELRAQSSCRPGLGRRGATTGWEPRRTPSPKGPGALGRVTPAPSVPGQEAAAGPTALCQGLVLGPVFLCHVPECASSDIWKLLSPADSPGFDCICLPSTLSPRNTQLLCTSDSPSHPRVAVPHSATFCNLSSSMPGTCRVKSWAWPFLTG